MTNRGARRRVRVPRPVGALANALPAGLTRLRRTPPAEPVALLVLVLIAVTATAANAVVDNGLITTSVQVVPLLGGGLLLGRRALRWLFVVVGLSVFAELVFDGLGMAGVRPGSVLALVVTALVAYEFARSREETGLAGAHGEGVLVELRHRLEQQGEIPVLPDPWEVDAVLRPAGGGPFAGDFVVSSLTHGGGVFEMALVDVSGKGVAAGTRALLLSGALGGLLGAVPPEGFLRAANTYLERQEWEEGFATAVHLVLRLDDGRFTVESAGHPPAALFHAGSGRWELLPAEGPALGLMRDVTYTSTQGTLEPGDALLLYTDGLVEVPGRDLSLGIDKLLGEAERLIPRGFEGGGQVLVEQVAADSTDDRGLVLLWRTG
jgi:hypothetical protein